MIPGQLQLRAPGRPESIETIALSLCEEILAFLLWVPRWIQRLVALAVQRFAVGPQGHIRSWCSLQLNVTDQAGR
jgi:hypothetical protein